MLDYPIVVGSTTILLYSWRTEYLRCTHLVRIKLLMHHVLNFLLSCNIQAGRCLIRRRSLIREIYISLNLMLLIDIVNISL